MKQCKKCALELLEDDFYKNHDECKKCWNKYCSQKREEKKAKDPTFLEKRRKYLQEWREKNKDKEKLYTKRSLEKNKEKIALKRQTPEYRAKMNELVKAWRIKNKDRYKETQKIRRKKDRKKELARGLVMKHVYRGHIIRPNKCEECMKECRPEAHHDDYEKALEVRWLCHVCHKHAHGKLLNVRS